MPIIVKTPRDTTIGDAADEVENADRIMAAMFEGTWGAWAVPDWTGHMVNSVEDEAGMNIDVVTPTDGSTERTVSFMLPRSGDLSRRPRSRTVMLAARAYLREFSNGVDFTEREAADVYGSIEVSFFADGDVPFASDYFVVWADQIDACVKSVTMENKPEGWRVTVAIGLKLVVVVDKG